MTTTRKILTFVLALIIALSTAISSSAYVISERYATVYYGDSIHLRLDKDENIEDITFKSSNERIAEVTDNGEVISVSPGTCIITATNNQTGKTDECEIHVRLIWWEVFKNIIYFITNLVK